MAKITKEFAQKVFESQKAGLEYLERYDAGLEDPETPGTADTVFAVSGAVREEILKRLDAIAVEHDVRILYAAETGSRGWGFPSKDSDYDVRFVYAHRPDWYLDSLLCPGADSIENSVESSPVGEMDVCGWDLVKALNLYRTSNAAIFEWLSSPIVYLENGSLAQRLRDGQKQMSNPYRLWHHYSGMLRPAEKRFAEKKSVKAWLYILRPLLMALWVEKHLTAPPMRFDLVMEDVVENADLRSAIKGVIILKRLGQEQDCFVPPKNLDEFVQAGIARAKGLNPTFPVPKDRVEYGQLFREVLQEASSLA